MSAWLGYDDLIRAAGGSFCPLCREPTLVIEQDDGGGGFAYCDRDDPCEPDAIEAALADRLLAEEERAAPPPPGSGDEPADGDQPGRKRDKPPRAPELRVLDTRKLLTTDPPPLDWIADGVWCRGKLGMPGGREKRGKSLFGLALAACAAAGGGEVAGITVKPAKVLLLDAENGEQEIHRRLRAIGLPVERAPELVVVEVRGFDLRQHLDHIERKLDEHKPDVLLLDSFRSLWRGKERDDEEVAAALDPLRDLAHDREVAISLAHHAQKGGDEYRGSTAIGACVEWVVMLERFESDPERRTRRRLTNPLARFAPEHEDRWLRIVVDGGSIRLEAAEPYEREHEAPIRDEIERALRTWIEGVSGVARTNGSTPLHPPTWSTADLARGIGRDPKDRTVREAVKRLAEHGVIYRNGAQRWSPAPTLFEEKEEER